MSKEIKIDCTSLETFLDCMDNFKLDVMCQSDVCDNFEGCDPLAEAHFLKAMDLMGVLAQELRIANYHRMRG